MPGGVASRADEPLPGNPEGDFRVAPRWRTPPAEDRSTCSTDADGIDHPKARTTHGNDANALARHTDDGETPIACRIREALTDSGAQGIGMNWSWHRRTGLREILAELKASECGRRVACMPREPDALSTGRRRNGERRDNE